MKNKYIGLIVTVFFFTLNHALATSPADTNPPPRLTIELCDGSRVVSTSAEKYLKFHSALLGEIKLAVKDIRSVECGSTNSARLITVNGDVLTVRFGDAALPVKTSFGKVELQVFSIRGLNVSPIVTVGNKAYNIYGNLIQSIPNLLGYWRFDSTWETNSCVNNYTGQLHGNARIGAAAPGCPLFECPGSQTLLLDGSDSFMTTSLKGQIDKEGTILAWIYLTAQPSAKGQIFSIVSQSEYGNDFDFQIQTDNRPYFFTDSGSSTVYPEPLSLNHWHFLAATFVANSARDIYLDGRLVANSFCGGHAINDNPFWFGNNQVFGPRFFQGQIGDVAIFNRALSAAEIRAAFEAADEN